MIKKNIQLVILLFFTTCSEEQISIPVPVTHEPEKIAERQVKLSASVVKNFKKDAITGFTMSWFSRPDLEPQALLVESDSTSGTDFFLTLDENRLAVGMDYYIRSYIYFDGKEIFGNEVHFTASAEFRQSINSVVPNHGKKGTAFEISGQYFVPSYTYLYLWSSFTGKSFPVQLTYVSDDKIVATVPDTEGTYGKMDLIVYTDQYGLLGGTSSSTFVVDP